MEGFAEIGGEVVEGTCLITGFCPSFNPVRRCTSIFLFAQSSLVEGVVGGVDEEVELDGAEIDEVEADGVFGAEVGLDDESDLDLSTNVSGLTDDENFDLLT